MAHAEKGGMFCPCETLLVHAGVKGKRTVKVVPKPGLALLHLHGALCLEHEAAEVKLGIKYVLRSDVMFA